MPTIEVNGTSTYYEDYGDGDPIVFCHGATGDHQLGAEQLRPLADEHRLIVYDLRGHGQTETAAHGDDEYDTYFIDLYAADLHALIEALELDRPVICGLSLGGMIGYRYATRYPDQLSGLITLGGPTPRTFSMTERLLRVDVARLLTPVMDNERVMRAVTWAVERLLSDTEAVDMSEVERIREAHPCPDAEMAPDERAKMMRGVRQYINTPLPWDRVAVPVLVMYGANEPFMTRHATYLAATLERCQTMEIPDASHNSHVDNPEFIVDAIEQFLAEQVDSTARAVARS